MLLYDQKREVSKRVLQRFILQPLTEEDIIGQIYSERRDCARGAVLSLHCPLSTVKYGNIKKETDHMSHLSEKITSAVKADSDYRSSKLQGNEYALSENFHYAVGYEIRQCRTIQLNMMQSSCWASYNSCDNKNK